MNEIVTKFSLSINTKGLYINRDILIKVDELCKKSLRNSDDEASTSSEINASTDKGRTVTAQNIPALLEKIDGIDEVVNSILMNYEDESSNSAMQISFEKDGDVEILAYGAKHDLEFGMQRVKMGLGSCDQEYHWLISKVTKSKFFLALPILSFLIFSISALVFTGYYFYAKSVGIDIDQSIVVQDHLKYIREVEKAIHTDAISEKLNILLKGQLVGFTNLTDVIKDTSSKIRIFTLGALISGVLIFLQYQLRKLFPSSFFEIGSQVGQYEKLVKKRDLWVVGIIIAFGINIISGIFVSFF